MYSKYKIGIERYIHTWNPNHPCFDCKGPPFEGLTFKNRSHGWALGWLLRMILSLYIHLLGTKVFPPKVCLKMTFQFPRWDMWSFPGGYSSICLIVGFHIVLRTSNDFPNCQILQFINFWWFQAVYPKKYSTKSGFLRNSFNLKRLLPWKIPNSLIKKQTSPKSKALKFQNKDCC